MSRQTHEAGNYSVEKNKAIFLEGQKVQSLDILLKGKVDVFLSPDDDEEPHSDIQKSSNSYRIFSVDQNVFIGSLDLFLKGKYSFSYYTCDNSILYAYPIHKIEDFSKLLDTQKEYSSYTITSIATMIQHSYTALIALESWMKNLMVLADNLSLFFWLIKERYNLTLTPSSLYISKTQTKYHELKNLGLLPQCYSPHLLAQEITELTTINYEGIDKSTLDKLTYYEHLIKLPAPLKKEFFSSDEYVTRYHFLDAAQNFNIIKSNMKEALRISESCFDAIYLEEENCIFSDFINLINEIIKYKQNTEEAFLLLDDLLQTTVNIRKAFQEDYCVDLPIDISKWTALRDKAKSLTETDTQADGTPSQESLTTIPEELVDSAEKIIRYSGISNEKSDLLRDHLNAFRNLNDKEVEGRSISNALTPLFFELYELVLKKVKAEDDQSKLMDMFLTFGYMDERLLTTEQVLALYALSEPSNKDEDSQVYSMREWLYQIHDMKKDPSINEFDQDYFDIFREMKKKHEVSDSHKTAYDKDTNGRLSFEVSNMFKLNHKLVYGHSNTYFPILHKDMIPRDLSKSIVTKKMVVNTLNKILEVDFSAFHREIFYKNTKLHIEKEIILKSVLPDIILMPTFGFRAIMWQDISGRVRSTPGRFILPIFTTEDLEELLLQLVGNFRWELCRTMMGMAWNDITQKSLTSEYMDYIQFYKKNKDLSEDAKEKIKAQIQRCNNRTRDVFTSDYLIWYKYESKGNIRLNKVARSILYKYCPLSKPLRERIENQPIFNELAIPFNIAQNKHAKDLENKYNKLLNNNIAQDPVLLENLNFYKEM